MKIVLQLSLESKAIHPGLHPMPWLSTKGRKTGIIVIRWSCLCYHMWCLHQQSYQRPDAADSRANIEQLPSCQSQTSALPHAFAWRSSLANRICQQLLVMGFPRRLQDSDHEHTAEMLRNRWHPLEQELLPASCLWLWHLHEKGPLWPLHGNQNALPWPG